MIMQPCNLLVGPLVACVWGIDIVVFLVALRWLLAASNGDVAVRLRTSIQAISDPLPVAIGRWLATKMRRTPPRWLPWAIVIAGLIIVRQVLAVVVMAVS